MEPDFKNYYDVLGVDFGADEQQIKSAYRKLARQYHPDMHPDGHADRFKGLAEAYETLTDPVLKTAYDRHYRVLVLKEEPRYAYPFPVYETVTDTTPPDPRKYEHKYTAPRRFGRGRLSLSIVGALLMLGAHIYKLVRNVAPVNRPGAIHPYISPQQMQQMIQQLPTNQKTKTMGDSLGFSNK
ncbi:MAG: DnaJ domain-containing protein [Edaphocola sp.]